MDQGLGIQINIVLALLSQKIAGTELRCHLRFQMYIMDAF